MDANMIQKMPGRDYSAEAARPRAAETAGAVPSVNRLDTHPAVADAFSGINAFEAGVANLRDRRATLLDQLREVDDALANVSKRAEMACTNGPR